MAGESIEVIPLTWLQKFRQWATLIMAILGALSGTVAVSGRGCGGAPGGGAAPTTPGTAPGTDPHAPPSPSAGQGPLDPWNALGRIQLGNYGCTATVIGKRRADGRLNILTAHHCTAGAPRDGTMVMRDGTTFRITYLSSDPKSDHAWFTSTLPIQNVPYADLATELPKVGDIVYHGGWGVDVPGNKETGRVLQPDNGEGQTMFELSVSSGDSGGGIALDATGKVLSPVCCTTAKGRKAQVWGATVTACRSTLPAPVLVAEPWTPIEIPIRMEAP